MDNFRSTKVRRVSKERKHRWKSRSLPHVIRVHNKAKRTIEHSTSSVRPLRVSTNSPDLSPSSTIQLQSSHQTPINALPEEREKKREKSVGEKKKKCRLWWIIGVALLCAFILIAIGTIIAVLIPIKTTTVSTSTTTSSTTSTTTTTSFSIDWNSAGITVAGITSSAGTGVSQLTNPFGVTLDASNILYIADRGNNRVQKWVIGAMNGTTIAGQSNGVPGSALNELNQPTDLEVDSSGNMYVTAILNYRVLFWPNGASSGTIIAGTGIAGSSNNQFNQAHGIAHDWNTGTLYATDFFNHRVMQYLSGASSGNVVAGGNGPGYNNTQLYNPVGLCFDSSSNSLFIANFNAHNIVRWVVGASSWTLVAGIGGSPGSTSTLLTTPGDVALDLMGNVYVADTGNHRIQFFLTGNSNGTTIAGITLSPGSTSSQLSSPFGVAVDAQCNVYIADYGNHRVQEFLHY